MNRFSVWSLISRKPDGAFHVRVRAVALADGIPFASADELYEKAGDVAVATRLRDRLVEEITARVTVRGDVVASVDSTFEM